MTFSSQYPVLVGFPSGSIVENPPADAGDVGDTSSTPGWRRYPGGGNGSPLWYSCLGNAMDRGAWWATVHGVEKESDRTWQLNNNNVQLHELLRIPGDPTASCRILIERVLNTKEQSRP